MNQKRIFLLISFFLVVTVIFIGAILNKDRFFNFKQKDSVTIKNDEVKNKSTIRKLEEVNCQKDWKKYKNDILGLGFCYPEKWGEAFIEPIDNLTLLDGALEQYSSDEHNAYSNSFFIRFRNFEKYSGKKGDSLQLKIFNENYKGEYYPNVFAYEKGYIDNIAELKTSKNICNYKLNFTDLWAQQGKITELWSECQGKIKNRIINHEEYFDKSLYSYQLDSLAYFKLKNNFFDNVLITRRYADITQIDKKVNEFDNFFEAKNYPSQVNNSEIVSKEEYSLLKEEFSNFVDSFYAYKPINEKKEDFKIIEGEDEKITTLRKYYWFLENQKLEEAYNMHNRINTSLDDFKTLYKKTRISQARDFSKINDNTYKFFVDYQDHNTSKTVFRIVARILSGQKIEIITIEEIASEMVRQGDYLAYAKKQEGKSFVILEQYGVATIIDEGMADYDQTHSNLGNVKFFNSIKFSESGDYLTYVMTGWEWSMTYIYDIKNSKQALEFSSGFSGFTKDEKEFFVCNSAGMATSPAGIIYDLPDFKKKFELFNSSNSDIVNVECNYDKNKNELTFIYDKGCEQGDKQCEKNEVVYSFNEDKMISSKTLNK